MSGTFLLDKLKAPDIIERLHLFSLDTRIPLRLMDEKDRECWRSESSRRNFCRQIYGTSNNRTRACRTAHRKAVREALRWGEVVTRTCCHFLMQITAPILHDGKLAGYLLAAPFSLVDTGQIPVETSVLFSDQPKERKNVEKALPSLPVVSEEEAHRAANALFRLADALSSPDLDCLLEVRKIQELQGKIADQIYSLKTRQKDFDPGSLTKLSFDEEKQIIAKIKLGDREGAKEILYRLLAILLSQYIDNFELLKISIIEFLIILTRTAVEAGTRIEEVLGIKYRFITESARIENQENLCIWVVQLLENFMDRIYKARHVKNYQRLEKAMNYIETHYDDSLSVEQIAGEVCLSPSRLSHIFKNELGTTLGDFIAKVRIEKAKQLLRNEELPVLQIALAVGFSDQSYFTKVFKSFEKCTPKAFRQMPACVAGTIPECRTPGRSSISECP